MEKDSVPYELRDLKFLEKTLLSKRILFKKLVIMHGNFQKLKGPYVMRSSNRPTYVMFYVGQQILRD